MLPQVERPGSMEKVVTALQALIKLLTPFETQSKWEPLPLQGDWIRYIKTRATAKFLVDPLGRVELTGGIYSDALPTFVIGQLPPQACPTTDKRFSCAVLTAGTTCVVDVFSSGVVQLSTALAAKSAISLDGIRFDTRV